LVGEKLTDWLTVSGQFLATTSHELGGTGKNFGSLVTRECGHRLPSVVGSCDGAL
jgi:hypothetical protein